MITPQGQAGERAHGIGFGSWLDLLVIIIVIMAVVPMVVIWPRSFGKKFRRIVGCDACDGYGPARVVDTGGLKLALDIHLTVPVAGSSPEPLSSCL